MKLAEHECTYSSPSPCSKTKVLRTCDGPLSSLFTTWAIPSYSLPPTPPVRVSSSIWPWSKSCSSPWFVRGQQMTAVRTQWLWFLCIENLSLLQSFLLSVHFWSIHWSSKPTKRETKVTYKWIQPSCLKSVLTHHKASFPPEAVPAPKEAHHLLCWNSLLKVYL